MDNTTLEEKKIYLLAELLGHTVYTDDLGLIWIQKNGEDCGTMLLSEYVPEQGGSQLTEVLGKMDDDKIREIIRLAASGTWPELCTWFQNKENAPAIVEAIYQVCKEVN